MKNLNSKEISQVTGGVVPPVVYPIAAIIATAIVVKDAIESATADNED